MKKLFILFIALLICGSAYGLNETASNGPQNITSCYMIDTGPVTSGCVVVLQYTSPTYPGKEVTFTAVDCAPIYGVVVDTNSYTVEQMDDGQWIRVQTYGYVDKILVWTEGGNASNHMSVSAGTALGACTASSGRGNGQACIIRPNSAEYPYTAQVTGNAIALSSYAPTGTTGTVEGWLNW